MASAGLYAIIRALTLKATKEAAKSAQRDADEVVPKVYRPTDELSLDPTLNPGGEAPTSFGHTPSHLDRELLVLEEYQKRFPKSFGEEATTKRGSSGTVEQQLDEIERELIDEGVLADIGASPKARSKFDATKSNRPEKPDARADEEAIKKELGFIPKDKYTRIPEGARQDLRAPGKIPRSDDIDITNARREAQIELLRDQLERQPELATRANLEELAKDVVDADVLDKAGKQFFGRQIAQEGDDFSMRDLEDLFLRERSAPSKEFPRGKLNIDPKTGRPTTPQGRAVLKAKAEGTTQVQGRSRGPKSVPKIPEGERSFRARKRPDPEGLEKPVEGEALSPQEKLTGPLKDEARLREAQRASDAEAHRADLMAIRDRRNDLTPRQEALKDAIEGTGKLTKEAVAKINKDFPPIPVKLSPRRVAGKQTTVESAVREQRGTKQRERGIEVEEVPEETTQITVFDEATGGPQVDEAGRIISDFIDRNTATPDSDLFGRTIDELSEARRIIAEQGGVSIGQQAPQGRPILPFNPVGPRSATPGVPYKLSDEEVLRNILIEILNTRGR